RHGYRILCGKISCEQIVIEGSGEFAAQTCGVCALLGCASEARQVAARGFAGAQVVNEPTQEINAGAIVYADRQVQRRLIKRQRDVPPTARDVEQVAGCECGGPERLAGWLRGRLDVFNKLRRSRLAIDAPVFAPCNLQEKDVVVVPMQIEAA